MRKGKVTLLAAAVAAMSAITAANAVEVLNEGDIAEPYSAPATLKGAVYDSASATASGLGIVELKLGKVNEKNKTSKISGSVTGLDGKKHAIKAFVAMGVDGASPKQAALEVKGLGTMSVTIGKGRFAGSLGTFHVQSASAGGNWTKTDSVVHVEVPDADLAKFAGAVVKDLLPDDEPVILSGGKWKFNKAAGVKWAKVKPGVEPFGGLKDEASGKGLLVDTSKGANLSGMKLVYTPKNGTFKGSFKVYALEGSGAKTKLKKYTINVSGVVVEGVGYGEATCKKPSVVWAVSVGAKGGGQEQTEDGQGQTGDGQEQTGGDQVQTAHEGVQLWAGGPYWAETNIGAVNPWEDGYYFWWGGTVGYVRSGGTWNDYGHGDGSGYYSGVTWVSSTGEQMSDSPFTSCPTSGKNISELQSEGYIDSTGNLVAAHDAATVHLGAPWRMPTDAEFSALIENCSTTWITTNGVYGRLVTGKGAYSNKSIFLPAAGYGFYSYLYNPGSYGLYWSSTPNSVNSYYAWSLYFDSSNFYRGSYGRYFGQSVRPVRGFAQ